MTKLLYCVEKTKYFKLKCCHGNHGNSGWTTATKS